MGDSRLRMDEFDYELPPSAIAHVPAEPRDTARLLVDRGSCRTPEHLHVADLPSLLGPSDVLVVNETRVMPARLPLRKSTGGAVEVLLLEPLAAERDVVGEDSAAGLGNGWAALVRPSRRIAEGTALVSERDPQLSVVVGPRLDRQRRAVSVLAGGVPLGDVSQAALLERAGEAPLPPYIDPEATRRAIAQRAGLDNSDGEAARSVVAARYQTVYARSEGSAAAPTAGLHLTDRVLDALRSNGVTIAAVDLTVGLATFAPVTVEAADDHEMHTEHYRVPAATLEACAAAERVVAVGTTTVRALESAVRQPRLAGAADAADVCGWTDLFLRRGVEFTTVDALLTNFHLPRSSLLLLIDAFIGPRWRDLYRKALRDGYRFLSFGDAMLLQRSGSS
ncbi:tRNA preQ1(34) S-adenosylmethionine ribosyltransferase-isomerase QueA [Candidatus Poriferisodalis sp.]|uniref:tRNA preQ1(34) S-adenosylmethionine ribosyltransferase-isomerase QueA n=1 Tax=Candidatus Poriferisodalis sp. TaxID=3101277 RepID=UPI003B01DAE4